MTKNQMFCVGFAAGVAALFLVKYGFFGLKAWNHQMHPERVDDPNHQFYCPIFGMMPCDRVQR